MFESYHETYDDFLSLTNLQTKMYSESLAELRQSLERTEAFLSELGSPQEKLKFVHIGGTSGKGSVANFMHDILLADGRKVATYTSPHMTTYLERFRVGKKLISPSKLKEYMQDLIKTYEAFLDKDKGVLSFFELSTCLALYAFEREGMEWCVLEVGCGGRYDATNIIPSPDVAIITNIDKDHTELLGSSLSKIAYEKAGIIKRGSTVFCGETRPKLREIFKKEAIKHSAALFFIAPSDKKLVDYDLGAHQQHNALLALSAAEELGIDEKLALKAIEKTRPLPCRFEIIQEDPVIVLDGAHSPVKMEATAGRIKDLFGSAHIIFGATATKDAKKMLKTISPVAKSITTTRFATTFRKVSNPAELLKMIPQSKKGGYFMHHKDALEAAKRKAKKNEPIVITGSLYLAGEMRAHWVSEEEILKNQSSF